MTPRNRMDEIRLKKEEVLTTSPSASLNSLQRVTSRDDFITSKMPTLNISTQNKVNNELEALTLEDSKIII